MHSATDEKVNVFSFPTDNNKCDRCVRALSNTTNVTKYIGVREKHWPNGVREKHWPNGYEKIRKKGSNILYNSPSIFEGVPKLYLP